MLNPLRYRCGQFAQNTSIATTLPDTIPPLAWMSNLPDREIRVFWQGFHFILTGSEWADVP
jgi:hypothetical protein